MYSTYIQSFRTQYNGALLRFFVCHCWFYKEYSEPSVFKFMSIFFCLQCDCFREGWNPLCRFLRLEPPDGDFPRLCMIILCNQLKVKIVIFCFRLNDSSALVRHQWYITFLIRSREASTFILFVPFTLFCNILKTTKLIFTSQPLRVVPACCGLLDDHWTLVEYGESS